MEVTPVFVGNSVIFNTFLGEVKDGKKKRFYTD